jgi:hypothetical protein
MKIQTIVVLLQAKSDNISDDSDALLLSIAVGLILFGLFLMIKKIFSNNSVKIENKYHKPPPLIKNVSTTQKRMQEIKNPVEELKKTEKGDTYFSKDNENELDEDELFDQEIKKLGGVHFSNIDGSDIQCAIVTKNGLFFVMNEMSVFLDNRELLDLSGESIQEVLVTPDGNWYYCDSDTGEWFKEGSKNSFWLDYFNSADENDSHPLGELEVEDDEISLDGKVLYSGGCDRYTAHPNFGVIVENENRIYINKHLNYEGYCDEFLPDPEGVIINIGKDYYLIRKSFPTPDLMSKMDEDEYEKAIENDDYDFVKNRIVNEYGGVLIQKDFEGEVCKSVLGPLFMPRQEKGKVYLRDQLIFDGKGDITNVVIDGESIMVEVDGNKWYSDGKIISDNEYYINYFGSIVGKSEKWEDEETLPDGTVFQRDGHVLYKNGEKFFNSLFSESFYTHPHGVVVISKDDELYFIRTVS